MLHCLEFELDGLHSVVGIPKCGMLCKAAGLFRKFTALETFFQVLEETVPHLFFFSDARALFAVFLLFRIIFICFYAGLDRIKNGLKWFYFTLDSINSFKICWTVCSTSPAIRSGELSR